MTTPQDDTTKASEGEHEVIAALDSLESALSHHGLDALTADEIDTVDAWANNVQLGIARHRRLRKPCTATFETATSGHGDDVHTCDLGASHEPVPHHCPICRAEWKNPDA